MPSDISLSRETENLHMKPLHQRGKVHLEPMAKVPQPTSLSNEKVFMKNGSSGSLHLPQPSGHRVGSLEKIENPPHLTKLQPLNQSVPQNNNRIDFSFKATFVLE